MKRHMFLLVTFLLATLVAHAQVEPTSAAANGADEQTVMQIVREYFNAHVRRDSAALDRIMATDFSGIYSSNGHIVDKGQSIRNFSTPEGPAYEFIRVDEIRVRVYGNAAVVTCVATEKGTYRGRDGERHNISSEPDGLYVMRATIVFVKEHDQWKIVAAQATHVT
jgi:ketosteroid isomerase-like protein